MLRSSMNMYRQDFPPQSMLHARQCPIDKRFDIDGSE